MNKSNTAYWVPAHPSYGAVSMYRYWRFLEQSRRIGDSWVCECPLGDSGIDPPVPASRFGKLWARKAWYPWLLRSGFRGSVAHIFDHSWADLLKWLPTNARKVVTIHDLIPLRYAGHLSAAQLARFRSWVEWLKGADHIISVSNYTKNEAMDLLGISDDKISVVPNGVDPPRVKQCLGNVRAILGLRDDDFVIGSLGSVIERKNLKILAPTLGALDGLGGRRVVLLRAGKKLPKDIREALFRIDGKVLIRELGQVTNDGLESFYASLDVLFFPSLLEGFGLPILEAMKRGVPVVASNTGSLPEVGGEAVLYSEPDDADHFAAQICQASHAGVASVLRRKGVQRANDFSWRGTLEGCYRVYDEVTGL